MKYLLTIALLLPSFSQAAISGWKEYQIPYNYIISNDIAKRKCGPVRPILELIKEKNNLASLDKIRIGDHLQLPICNDNEELYISSSAEYPLQEKPRPENNSSNIVSWEKVTVPKGYILSKDLVYQKNCNLNWTKQIAEFKEKNPKVKNVNVLFPNKEIWIQTCKDEQLTADLKKAGISEEAISKMDGRLTYLIGPEFRFDLYGGAAYLEKLTHLVGIGLRGNVYDTYGFELKLMNFGMNAFFLGEFEYKDKNNYKVQYNLTVGIVDYILNEKTPTQSSGTLYATYGYIFRPSPITVFEIEAGLNLANTFGFIGSMSGMKKIGAGDTWLGLFLESRSFSTPQRSQNNLLLSGLKLSF